MSRVPGVYLENIKNRSLDGKIGLVSAFFGLAPRGLPNEPILVSSYSEFSTIFLTGDASDNKDFLALSVLGFFENGGSSCYIIRAGEEADYKYGVCSELKKFEVTSPGAWSNDLTINVKKSPLAGSVQLDIFDIEVKYRGKTLEKFTNVANDANKENHFRLVLRASKYIKASDELTTLTETTYTFASGESPETLEDIVIVNSLNLIRPYVDIDIVAVPGYASTSLLQELSKFAKDLGIFAILDSPQLSDTSNISSTTIMLDTDFPMYYPWVNMKSQNEVYEVPPSALVAGVYNKIIQEMGVGRAPAGTVTSLKGVLGTNKALEDVDLEKLTLLNIVPLVTHKNHGVALWGAKTLSTDPYLQFINIAILNIYIRKQVKDMLLPFVFEPNTTQTWISVSATVETFLNDLYRSGALKGTSENEAYYVKCDSDTTTNEDIENGILNIELGFAGKKPAEFIVVKFSQSLA